MGDEAKVPTIMIGKEGDSSACGDDVVIWSQALSALQGDERVATFDEGIHDRAIGPPDGERDNPAAADSHDVPADAQDARLKRLDRPAIDGGGGGQESEEDREVPGQCDVGNVRLVGEQLGAREEVVVESTLVLLDVSLEGTCFGREEMAKKGWS